MVFYFHSKIKSHYRLTNNFILSFSTENLHTHFLFCHFIVRIGSHKKQKMKFIFLNYGIYCDVEMNCKNVTHTRRRQHQGKVKLNKPIRSTSTIREKAFFLAFTNGHEITKWKWTLFVSLVFLLFYVMNSYYFDVYVEKVSWRKWVFFIFHSVSVRRSSFFFLQAYVIKMILHNTEGRIIFENWN